MKSDFLLPVLIGLLVLAATASGLFYKTTEAHWQHTTVRGQQAIFQGHGLYRYDPAVVAREGIIWDATCSSALPLPWAPR